MSVAKEIDRVRNEVRLLLARLTPNQRIAFLHECFSGYDLKTGEPKGVPPVSSKGPYR